MDLLQYPFDGATILQKKRSIKKELLQRPGLVEKRVAIVCGSTLGEIRNIVEIFLLAGGIKPIFHEGEYGLFYEDVVFDDGSLAAFKPDILYIHTSSRNLSQWPTPADSPAEAEAKLDAEYARFEAVWKAAAALGCPVVQNNFEEPSWRNFGNLDAWDVRGRVGFTRELNRRAAAFARENPWFYIHDFAWLAATQGLDAFCDDAAWYAYKYACAVAHIPTLCHSLAGLILSLFGRTKKAVVTDLDNTLWGGVVGEVGPEGIDLGSETPQGMAYAEYQSYLKMLAGRGILLAVASKNEEAAAKSGFARAGSPLSAEDFLQFEAHWEPKSQSLARIAQNLNIGTDSLVFTDDNPAEREQVTREMPEVVAPPIGQPEDSVRLLDRGGYFETTSLSADDVKRGEMYRQNAQRQEMQAQAGDYESYLKSLAMKAEIAPFGPEQLERVTQLINKTNQFNLTTRRYTAAEVTAIAEDEGCITLAGRLEDKFGDNGITSAIIGRVEGETLQIDLWIMSCRVFKRHLEYAMFDALVAEAAKRGVSAMKAAYLPTAKNLLVKDFYATIGFVLESENEAGERFFRYDMPEGRQPMNTVIEVL